jgi:2',3'-cyclic-nucleotide 2'-phosphodiesterase/3'-nucleotidase
MQKGKTSISHTKSQLIPVERRGVTEQIFVNSLVHVYTDKLGPIMQQKIGESQVELAQYDYHTHIGESPLTNFMMDTIREHTGADFSVTNSSTFRTKIPAGEITTGLIYQMLPWQTHLSSVKMTGKEIKQGLEQIMSSFLHNFASSGFTIEVDSSKPCGNRIVNMYEDNGKPVDPDKVYKVSTIAWLANGNANVDAFQKGTDRVDSKTEFKEILIDKIKNNGNITAMNDSRVVDLASQHTA